MVIFIYLYDGRIIYQHLVSQNMTHMYGFINPAHSCSPNEKPSRRAQLMSDAMQNAKPGQLFFAPYNENYHWTLGIIDPSTNTLFWFDPVGSEVREKFRLILNRSVFG